MARCIGLARISTLSTWPALMDALAVRHRAPDALDTEHAAEAPAQGEAVGADAGVEVDEQLATFEELRHP